MRLADFIDANTPAILAEWELFASSLLPAAAELDAAALRDHAQQILQAVAEDLRTPQTRVEQSAKSKGRAPVLLRATETAAQTHGRLRAKGGFTIRQLVSEYRALRASVLRLWGDAGAHGPDAMEDAGRFNEAIDQAIAESTRCAATQERIRQARASALASVCSSCARSRSLTAEVSARSRQTAGRASQ
jgi:hypothetical protein